MNKIIKIMFLISLILFLSLYFSKYTTDYYENKKIMTDEAIERFENDLKKGKVIDSKDYLEQEKNYNNRASKLGIKASQFIELAFDKSFNLLMKYLEHLQNS